MYVQTEGLWLGYSLANSTDSTGLVVPASYITNTCMSQARSFHVSPLSIRSAPFALEPLTGPCVKEVCTLDYVQLGCHKR